MKRSILRWCISWWFDTSRPQWLRSAMKKDSALLQYELELEQMAVRLRADAPSWASDVFSDGQLTDGKSINDSAADDPLTDVGNSSHRKSTEQEAPHPPHHRHGIQPLSLARRRIITIAATAATLAVAASVWHIQVDFLSTSRPDVSVKRKTLAAAESEFNALLTVVNETKSRMTDKVSFLPTLMEETIPTAANINSLRHRTRSSFETLARGYGQALTLIHQSARQQVIGEDSALQQIMRSTD